MTTWDLGPEPVSKERRPLTPLVTEFERLLAGEVAGDPEQLPSVMCRAAARALGMDGAGLCVQVGANLRLPLGASDALAATAERLQFTSGEGPCFEAMAQGRPITLDRDTMSQRWPFLAALHQEAMPFETGLAVPLRAGGERFGVLDLYSRRPQRMDGHDVVAAQLVAQATADALLEVLQSVKPDVDVPLDPGTWCMESDPVRRRRNVWVAIGMINLKLGLQHDDALAVPRQAAVARGQDLDYLAHDIVNGDADFDHLGAGLESHNAT